MCGIAGLFTTGKNSEPKVSEAVLQDMSDRLINRGPDGAGLWRSYEGEIGPIPTMDYPTPAKRPLNSRMECGALEQAFGIPRPDWRDGLNVILHDLEGTK